MINKKDFATDEHGQTQTKKNIGCGYHPLIGPQCHRALCPRGLIRGVKNGCNK
jgi:hypothetical protein